MPKLDTDAIKASRSIDDVIGAYVDLKPNGREFEACCPFHEEKTPSFRVVPDKDFFHCFGCGANGDAIDFVMEHTGADFRDACEAIAGKLDLDASDAPKRKTERVNPYDLYQPVSLAPESVLPVPCKQLQYINPKRDHKNSKVTPSHVWPYRDIAGNVVSLVIRFDIDGKKITPCLRWCHYEGGEGWVMYAMADQNRPLFNLVGIATNTEKQIVIVEGEKAAQKLQQLVGEALTVTCWLGGTNAINKTDWRPLANRRVIIIPDADEPGFDAAGEVMQRLFEVGSESIKVVVPEDHRPKGWDVADEDWKSAKQFIQWAKDNIGQLQQPEPDEQEQHQAIADQEAYFSEQFGEQGSDPEPTTKPDFNAPFQLLGYNEDYFYFLPKGSQQVKCLTAPGLAQKANLLTLAPADHWRTMAGLGPDEEIKSKHWEMHINGLIQKSYDSGVFDVSRIRGRGAWIDEGRNILHVGDSIYVDGVKMNPEECQSNHIYPRNLSMGVEFTNPASNQEAHELVKICGQLSWDKSLSGALLAGWCVVAPLCGMLNWRPHIWVTGASGSGKSTVMNDIIDVMLGKIGLKVEGKTTEAGIRQMLGTDARPVLFDEAEAEDEASARRLQGILDFARVSSSGGTIIKGTTGGRSMEFSARSAFCFSSINTTVKHFADEARITKLVLKRDIQRSDEFYQQFHESIKALITPEYANKMISRSISHLPTIKSNAEVFIRAATAVFESRRAADQIGTMLAGTYLCYSTKAITFEQAKEWILRFDWTEHTIISASTDSDRLIERIATTRISISADRGRRDLTVGEAILITAHNSQDSDECKDELKRLGVKLNAEKTRVTIANNSRPMADLLNGSPWAASWARTLSEIHDAAKEDHQHFAPGIKSRGVSLPVAIFAE